jgi:CCR4-NOT transcriptional regulation complex NOT5 subunit
VTEEQILSTAEIKANELLGEVKGEELFQTLATRSLISKEKREATLTQLIENKVKLRDKLSNILSSRALSAAAYERHRRLIREGMLRRGHTEEQFKCEPFFSSPVLALHSLTSPPPSPFFLFLSVVS